MQGPPTFDNLGSKLSLRSCISDFCEILLEWCATTISEIHINELSLRFENNHGLFAASNLQVETAVFLAWIKHIGTWRNTFLSVQTVHVTTRYINYFLYFFFKNVLLYFLIFSCGKMMLENISHRTVCKYHLAASKVSNIALSKEGQHIWMITLWNSPKNHILSIPSFSWSTTKTHKKAMAYILANKKHDESCGNKFKISTRFVE